MSESMTIQTAARESEKSSLNDVRDGTADAPPDMFEYLARVHNLEEFLSEFPQVSREWAVAEFKKKALAEIDQVVHSDKSRVSGWPVFRGTRLPVKNLFDYLADGYTLDEFLEHFPSASKEQAMTALNAARKAMEAQAYESASR